MKNLTLKTSILLSALTISMIIISSYSISIQNQSNLNFAIGFLKNDPIFYHPQSISEKIFKIFCDKDYHSKCEVILVQNGISIARTPDTPIDSLFSYTSKGEISTFSPKIKVLTKSQPTAKRIVLSLIYTLLGFSFLSGIGLLIQRKLKKKVTALESKNEELKNRLSTIATMVAHDLRAPVAVLQTIADQDHFDEDSRKILNLAINRVSKISNELLETKKELNSHANMSEVINEITILNKGVSIINKVPEGFILPISPHSMTRHLQNLINNSIEAGSSIITLKIHHEDSHIILQVEDNGRGIEKNVLNKLGSMEFSTKGSLGNGLGLKALKNELDLLSGRLSIYSTVNIGTQINIAFKI